MLLYIIDGYNLTHKVKSLKNSSTPQADLIRYLAKNRLTGSKNNKVIIVFDGNLEPGLRQRLGFFQVFASGQNSADDLIKKKAELANNKSEVVVVTDDRALRDSVRRFGVKLCRIAEFISKKQKKTAQPEKDISHSLQHEITEEMRKIWLNE